ncbi:hypothetical protein ASC94_09225 [Massilia sp. Root418]|uniref:hypothetical protein n=1 Tax=Massilia sp. Root418 TaxID=1736532 RepID=UPI0007136C35|nr:hypothetical protein [Massilia sp. Root418]KQW96978.1 hypothetical protein ASC94_09225 [Massilia sp. Root418]
MTQKYKVKVSNTVLVPVQGTLADSDGQAQPFKIVLVCERLAAKQLRTAFNTLNVVDIPQFLTPLIKGWREQDLVLEQDGTPAEFCSEALEALFNIAGIPQLVFNTYNAESAAKAKN